MNIYKEDNYFVIENIYDDGRVNGALNLPFNSVYLDVIDDETILFRSSKCGDVLCSTTLDMLTINGDDASLATLYADFDSIATAQGGSPGPSEPDWFTVTNLSDVDGSVGFYYGGSTINFSFTTVDYSYDGENWTTWNNFTIYAEMAHDTIVLPANGCIYFRNGDLQQGTTATVRIGTYINGDYALSGKLSHLSSLNMNPTTYRNLFRRSFVYEGYLVDASKLILPTTLQSYMYDSLFKSQTRLVGAPALPATQLATGCYSYMFSGCTSLTTAPELPATVMYSYCYDNMFADCTSLTTAPTILPATTLLAQYCYQSMFYNCSSLTTAPELPANTILRQSYYQMFANCTSLNYIKCLATERINYQSSTISWVSGVSATGTFVKTAGATWPTGINGIPDGWTVVEV